MSRTALLLGATGLVGRELLGLLLEDERYGRVTVVGRRATGNTHPKLSERVFDLSEMQRYPDAFAADAIFCALGTTIKTAGSRERFRAVDYDYPLMAARLGKEQGATHYLLVTALGANARSRIFYNRVKGEVEREMPCAANAAAPITANRTPARSRYATPSGRRLTFELLDTPRVTPPRPPLGADARS